MTRDVAVYDTTLRDGTQREGLSLSCDDKLLIAERLDRPGVAFIEGGWPGSNRATGAVTRVLIETSDGQQTWGTVGASSNIIDASWRALTDAIEYGLRRHAEQPMRAVAP